MQLFIKDGLVYAYHTDDQDIPLSLYPGCERMIVPDGTPLTRDDRGAIPAPPLTEEIRRSTFGRSITDKANEIRAHGYKRNFGGTTGTRFLAYSTEADAMYWLGQQGKVLRLVIAGDDDAPVTFRDASGSSFTIPAHTANDALIGLQEWTEAIDANVERLRTDLESTSSVDVETGWPE